jgi:HprK-related kinase A
MFEWCLNWCIESQANHYLMMHAAIVAKGDYAAILAAPPGSGKSTLAAGLVTRGWRLLSDELTLLDPTDGRAFPLARPVSLKNESIRAIQEFAPDTVMGPVAQDTIKGSVAHMKPPRESVDRAHEPALPRWVIFPKFERGARASLVPYPRSLALVRLADQAFNYSQYGVRSFDTFVKMIDHCDGYEFTYSDLHEAIDIFDSLVTQQSSKII